MKLLSLAAVFVLAAASASAAGKHLRHRPAAPGAAAQQQIACTQVGCIPIPRGCHVEMGRTPDGIPTGFDVAVCGNITMYGFR